MITDQDTGNSSRSGLLAKKVGVLLGLRGQGHRSLTRPFTDVNLELLTDPSPSPPEGTSRPDLADLSHIDEQVREEFQPVPPVEPGPEAGDWGRLLDEVDYLRHGALSDSILRTGIYLGRYRVATRDQGNGFPVLFRRDEQEMWWQIAAYSTREEAVIAVNHLRRFLVRLSVDSEGLHVIEHILLRPLSPSYSGALADPETRREFYSFKISVFFPAWTARCRNAGFRHLAETTVRENCPAHVHPEFHWLDFSRMRLLEDLYQHWTTTRNDANASAKEIDAASLRLVGFIRGTDDAQPGSSGGSQ